MKYFLHDSNAFNDEKITELYLRFGYEGLGLFYTLLEKLASQEKPIKTIVLKSQLKVGKKLEKCWFFMEEIELISSNNGDTFNKQLLNFSEKYNIKKEKNNKRISEWRKNQDIKENVTCYESVCNAPKVKESKVNESKVNESKVKECKEGKENKLNEFNFKQSLLDLGVSEKLVYDWLIVRKNKKASNTETAFNVIKSQIYLSGITPNECIETAIIRSWSGFQAKWLENINNKPKINDYDTENLFKN